ncbi:hypothetical protein [Prauserella muralis]|uniref:Uncharacterized protein n=1 Tax=Prauserella muralis TaxID=588067 RepID=A0A2V4B2N0_9PSEU|nr:hypothetical protein [Prauserella muralis]PXY27395.1 hypothetical protein BAY60_13250 [Prauserella muralis]TWE22910.1 hypothetical protein FHX69_4166 [Prauserella muralis]
MDGRGWHVEVKALEQAARGISESVRDQDSFELRELCGDTSLYGHGGLHAALMNFCTRWSEGLDYLNDDAQDIADSLGRVAQKYRETDQAAARTLPDPAVQAVDD